MRTIFRIPAASDEVWILHEGSPAAPGDVEALPPRAAAWALDTWLPRAAGRSHALLLELAAELGVPVVARPDADVEPVRALVRDALERGVLRAYRILPKLSGAPVPGEVDPPSDRPPAPAEKKTFIAISLVDDANPPNPVPFKRYRLELTDGSTKDGMLDANGKARVDGIDAGTCRVSFPDFHGDDWAPL